MPISRQRVIELLGGLPGNLRLDEPHSEPGPHGLTALRFAGSHGETVPALYLPGAVGAPAVLYCHAHGGDYGLGTAELFEGRSALAGPYLGDLAAKGYAVLCVEMPCFGSRAEPKEGPRSKALLWQGRTLYGQMLAELMAGAEWLRLRHPRIAALGLSMGGLHAYWLAALDPRLAATVSLCAFSDLGDMIATGEHDRHGHYMTVPGLLAETTIGELAGLGAPMPQFFGVGLQDWASRPAAFEKARAEVTAAYGDKAGVLGFHVEPDTGHMETPAMRAAVLAFLARHLG